MCTGIRLTAKNGALICARTLEFGFDIASKIIAIPRGYSFTGSAPAEKKGLIWQSSYAVAGANAADIVGIVDGINDQGLAGGLFYFPDYAQFQEPHDKDFSRTIAPWELLTWILTTCATIAEIKEKLPKIVVANTIFAPWGFVPPVHAVVHDTQGNSIVIEYTYGALTIHDNPLGVVTNAPTFDWHLTNLKNYIPLSPLNVPPKKIGSLTFSPLGQGSGMLGLPGDFTSPSRFVRAVAFSQSAVQSATETDTLAAAFHILNVFDIPQGAVQQQTKKGIEYEYTQWTSATDMHNKRYYFHTHINRRIGMIDLLTMHMTANTVQIFPMHIPESTYDVTHL